MNKFNIFDDIEGMDFPLVKRRTRVMYGENGAVNGEYFCQGYVVIQPGGSIPLHNHETIETYTILKGHGQITIGEETAGVKPGDSAYIDKFVSHGLFNDGGEEMHMMFVYAPKMIAEHWAQESAGGLH